MSGSYSLRDVQRMLGIAPRIVSAFVGSGFVTPTRGKRREYRFSFQDLIAMKAAQELSAANIGAARISRSLRHLREQLPTQLPLAGLRIAAVGNRVVVQQGAQQWQPDSGQFLLDFGVTQKAGSVAFLRTPTARDDDTEALFEQASALESSDVEAAVKLYRRVIELDAAFLSAYINLGRLQHAQKRYAAAEQTYRAALDQCQADATLLFNLGVLLEDLGRGDDASLAYRSAIRLDAKFADAHYNLALLYEKHGDARQALRHLNSYRRLQGR